MVWSVEQWVSVDYPSIVIACFMVINGKVSGVATWVNVEFDQELDLPWLPLSVCLCFCLFVVHSMQIREEYQGIFGVLKSSD